VSILFILVIIYVIYSYAKTMPQATNKGPLDLWAPESVIVVSRADATKVMSSNYTFAFYIKMDAVPDMRSSVPLLLWPRIWNLNYNPAQETMILKVAEAPDGTSNHLSTTELPNVPLQKWTQICMTSEGRTIDLYVNGVLIKSTQFDNIPPANSASITIVPQNIMGQIAYVQAWPYRLLGSAIQTNYTDTSDSQGRPLLGPDFFKALIALKPNLYCGKGCSGKSPTASLSQTWEFPFA
jgi:hypothetical protein